MLPYHLLWENSDGTERRSSSQEESQEPGIHSMSQLLSPAALLPRIRTGLQGTHMQRCHPLLSSRVTVVPASDVGPGTRVGGLAAWRAGLDRAVGDLDSRGDAHTWLQTNQVRSQAKPKNIACVCVCVATPQGNRACLGALSRSGGSHPLGGTGPNREGCRQHNLSQVVGHQGLLYFSLHCTHVHFFHKCNTSHNSFSLFKKTVVGTSQVVQWL